jgi:hypothetical protein
MIRMRLGLENQSFWINKWIETSGQLAYRLLDPNDPKSEFNSDAPRSA